MINTVIFDIGNVLTTFAWEEHIKKHGHDKEMIMRIAKATVNSDDWKQYDIGIMTDDEIMDEFIKNDPEIGEEIREVFSDFENLVLKRDYAIPWIKELKAKGFRVLYLSNFSNKAETECAAALDFIPYTDGGILSYKDKVIKPELEIYDLLAKRYGLIPSECIFFDDTKANVDAAIEYGYNAVLFTDYESARDVIDNFNM